MAKVAEGPSLAPLDDVARESEVASFRIITSYDTMTDRPITRFDVLLGFKRAGDGRLLSLSPGMQFNCGMFSGAPGNADLWIPPDKGILGAFALRVSPRDLCDAFRGLADAIEKYACK